MSNKKRIFVTLGGVFLACFVNLNAHAESDLCRRLWRQADKSAMGIIARAQYDAACNQYPDDDRPDPARLLGALDRLDIPESKKAIARAWLVSSCLRSFNEPQWRYAACGYDARRLDKAAFDAEVGTLETSPNDIKLLNRTFERAVARAAEFEALANSWVNADDKRLAVDEVTRLIDSNVQMMSAEPAFASLHELLGKAEAMLLERQLRNNVEPMQLDGCADNRSKLDELVAAGAPKTPEDVRNILWGSPLAWLRLDTEMVCAAVEGRLARAGAILRLGEQRRRFFGPRLEALVQLGRMLSAPDANFQTALGRFSFSDGWIRDEWSPNRVAAEIVGNYMVDMSMTEDVEGDEDRDAHNRYVKLGRIAAIKPTDNPDLKLVTFKTEKWSIPAYACTKTGRVAMFEGDGTPIWESNCKVSGDIAMALSLPEIIVTASEASPLKPGLMVKVAIPRTLHPKMPNAYIFELTEGKGKAQRAIRYFDFPLASAPPAKKGK